MMFEEPVQYFQAGPIGPSCAFGLKRGEAFVALKPGTEPHVKVRPHFDALAFGNLLGEQTRASACRINAGEPSTLPLGRQRAVKIASGGKPSR
jgi:hypothetical protein